MRLLLLGALLWFSGCDSPLEPLPYPITFTPEGLGTVHLGKAYDIQAIQSRLPGIGVEKLSLVTTGENQSLLALKRGERLLAYVIPDRREKTIQAITVLSPLIEDPNGLRVGETLRQEDDLRCLGDECHYGVNPSVRYRTDPARIIREITLQKL